MCGIDIFNSGLDFVKFSRAKGRLTSKNCKPVHPDADGSHLSALRSASSRNRQATKKKLRCPVQKLSSLPRLMAAVRRVPKLVALFGPSALPNSARYAPFALGLSQSPPLERFRIHSAGSVFDAIKTGLLWSQKCRARRRQIFRMHRVACRDDPALTSGNIQAVRRFQGR
jgi:hypothetical protein